MVATHLATTLVRTRKILLVEDNPDVARACGNILAIRGHQVFLASDGVEALKLARTATVDVVLCDIGMPGMDGFEVARRLRADPRTANLPLCALTAYGAELTEQALQSGFDKLLVKPAPLRELYGFVEAA